MQNETNTAENTPARPAAGRERKLIGDRGDHLLRRIQGETGFNLSACYQCERCTNACPVSHYMDIKPHQVIRYIQLGWREDLLGSSTIWVCLSCEMCSTYCPNEVAVAETINHLRNMAVHSAIAPKERTLAVFHQTFLEELQRSGRINELWLMKAFNLKPNILTEKLRSGELRDELHLAWALWKKRRLHLLPRRSKAIQEIKAVYRQKRGEIL
jgi:heterodisulfide reductase subunit C